MKQQVNIPPTYKEMFESIGTQLSSRKKTLLKRTLLISWPYLLFFIIYFIVDPSEGLGINDVFTGEDSTLWMVGAVVAIFFAIIYSMVIGFIFDIEKRIWVDSHFDNRQLEPKDSWRIAMKLFWPAFHMRLRIVLAYYLFPIFGMMAVTTLLMIAIFKLAFDGPLIYVFLALPVLFVIGIFVYSYYIRTKLRYVWFIFLDRVGTSYSYRLLIDEMKKLNEVSRTETFKKSLVTNIGTDSANVLANVAVNSISYGLSMFGKGGKLLGGLTQVYGKELTRQATDLGNIAAQYIIYKFATKEVYGNDQIVNEELYRM